MAVCKILRIGDPNLRKISLPIPVEEIRSKEIKKLIRDMFETLDGAEGVGLAAPQIGVNKRLVVVGPSRERYPEVQETLERRVLINPEIEILKGEKEGFWEGCLSVPDMRGFVERIRRINLKWYDEKEERHEEIIEGFPAVVYQHECDHLDGILYVDRLKNSRLFGFNAELDQVLENKTRVAV